jgi:hypothetical protein
MSLVACFCLPTHGRVSLNGIAARRSNIHRLEVGFLPLRSTCRLADRTVSSLSFLFPSTSTPSDPDSASKSNQRCTTRQPPQARKSLQTNMFGKGRRSGSYRSSRADGRRSRADGRRSNASRTSESDGIRNASGHSSTSTSRTSSTSVTDQSAFLTTPDPDPLPAQPQAPFFGVAFAPSHLPAFEPQQVGPGQAPFLFPGPHQGYYAASPAAGTDDGSHDGSDDSAASLAVSPGSPQSSNP